jgi:hypothetical protein
MVLVKIMAAMICFSGHCYPALVGNKTPTGTFTLVPYITKQKGYGGEVLAFAEDKNGIYAIHRVWVLAKWQHRMWRIKHGDAEQRKITDGCINVMPIVFVKLLKCCSYKKLIIVK